MSRPEAGGTSVAVVVLPSGQVGTHVLDLVRRWYASGLLQSAIWVLPEGVSVGDTEAPRVEAHYLSASGASSGDLFAMVARHRWRWVRLVLTQVLYRSDTVDEEQLAAAESVRRWLRESLPESLAGGVDGTELRAINLVTGVTGLSSMPLDLRPMHWDVHVVTSPEDRPSPERANLFVRSGSNLVPLSVLATAVVAGLVPGQSTGPFDQIDGDQSAVYGKAVVLRPTIRGLAATGVVDAVARQVVEMALANGSTVAAHPESFVHGERAAMNQDLLEWLDQLDHSVFGLRRYDEGADVGTETITVAQGAGEAARFVVRALITLMWSVVHWLRRNVEVAATKVIVGQDSGVRLTLHADVAPDLAEQVVGLEARELERIERSMTEIERRPPRAPVPSVWRELTSVAHGVLDGGTLPPRAPEHRDGTRRMLLSSPHDVVVDPRDTFTVDKGDVVGVAPRVLPAWSPDESQQLGSDLQEARATLEAEQAAARAELESLTANPPADEAARPAYDEAVNAARTRFKAAEVALSRCTATEVRFDAWMRRRVDGLLWRLGDSVVGRRRRAATVERSAREQALTTMGLDEGAPGRLRARYLRVSWFAILLTAAYLAYRWYVRDLPREDLWALTGGLVLVVFVVVVLAALWWFRGVLRILHEYRRGAVTRARGLALFERAHGDRRRLDDVVRQLGQWIELLGWSLHTPWASLDESVSCPSAGEVSSAATESREESDVDSAPERAASTDPVPSSTSGTELLLDHVPLPACFVVGMPVIEDSDRVAIARQSMNWLMAPGWRSRAWRRLVGYHLSTRNPDEEEIDHAVGRLEREDGRGSVEREQLLDDLRLGRPQRSALEAVLVATRAYLRASRMCGKSFDVQDVRETGSPALSDQQFLAAALVPASAFAKETWSAQAQVSGGHEQLQTQCWTKAPAEAQPHGGEVLRLDQMALDQSSLLDVIVRVDVSRWRDASDLRIFGTPPEDERAHVFEGVDEDFV